MQSIKQAGRYWVTAPARLDHRYWTTGNGRNMLSPAGTGETLLTECFCVGSFFNGAFSGSFCHYAVTFPSKRFERGVREP
jgi:hypothetical protein